MSGTDETPPDVSIVVVNFEGACSVEACLDSLVADATRSREILVVDNASTDGSPDLIERIAAAAGDVRLLRSDHNLGYAGAVDLALPHCRGRYVAVLNMDVVVEPGWLEPLVGYLDGHDEVAAASPLLLLAEGDSVNAAGQWIHVTGLGFNRELESPREVMGDEPFAVAGLHGAAFAVRRELLDRIGGMDAGGFLYHEDVNLSWLLRMMGYELACVPASVVRHDYFLSMHPGKLELLERNREAMLRAYLEPATRRRLLPWRLLTELMLWGYALLRGPDFLRAKQRALRWVRGHDELIRQRRALATRLRVRSDEEVMRPMTRGYPIRQLLTLASERGAPRRPLP